MNRYRRGHSPSSSPDYRAPSSPPPHSPPYSFPRIQLSPHSPDEDYHLPWPPHYDPVHEQKAPYSLPSFRSLFPSDDEHPLTSEYDASEYSEPDVVHDDAFLTESEDEEDQDPFFSDTRVTFFSTSAERLKSDPLPRHTLRISARTTSPAPLAGPSIVTRNISEPAPSTQISPSDNANQPLPKSSPVLSPVSLSVSPLIGSVSPLSILEPLSPLSLPPSSLAGDHDMDMDLETFPEHNEPTTSLKTETGLGLFDPTPISPVVSSSPCLSSDVVSDPASDEGASSIPSPLIEDHVANTNAIDVNVAEPAMPKKKSVVKLRSGDAPVPAAQGSSIPQKDTVSRIKKPKPNGEKQDKQQLGDKGKKRSQQSLPDEAPITKKARKIHTSSEASGSGGGKSQRVEKKSDGKPEARPKPKQPKCSAARNAASAIPEPKPKPRKARPRSPSPSTSSSRSASPEPQVQTPPNPELDPELCGMLIECMATSRASSLPMSTLYKSLMQSYPSLKSRGTEGECLDILERVLENGTVANGGSGVFGKVQSSGHDDSDRPLEAQWFYVPERDQDQERAVLIRSMMPRPAKRSETKKFKQYYYRPLGKISRWDPEDEL